MKHLITATAVALSFAIASPAMAGKAKQKFESTLSAPVTAPIKVEVIIGEDLAHRANNLPKDRRDRGFSSRSPRSGFTNNGFYGERDLNKLADRLQSRMEKRLVKQGVTVTEDAGTVLKLVLTDARPNRPTFRQLSSEPSLSYRSFGLGGAAFEGALVSNSGAQLGELSYAWYESDIRDAAYFGTWSDAHRAIDFFARKTAKTISQ